ncbi:MAG: hypothetical protein LRS48_00295 [Desulfurococcales archaeon]|nr:hypothetical protein [Desulfurococcales archaeon]
MEEREDLIVKLARLARLKVEDLEEASKYIEDATRFLGMLGEARSEYENAEPLYYVWDGILAPGELPRSVDSDSIDLKSIFQDRLDPEGRVVLPWKPKG